VVRKPRPLVENFEVVVPVPVQLLLRKALVVVCLVVAHIDLAVVEVCQMMGPFLLLVEESLEAELEAQLDTVEEELRTGSVQVGCNWAVHIRFGVVHRDLEARDLVAGCTKVQL